MQEVPNGVPPQYNDPNKTPLEVGTAEVPFDRAGLLITFNFGSVHANGFNVALCDSSVRSISTPWTRAFIAACAIARTASRST